MRITTLRHATLAAAFAGAVAAFAPGAAHAAVQAPQLPPGQSKPIAAPYDTSADAHAAVDAAFAKAKAENKLVLVDFGGNWCPDCRIFAGIIENPAVSPWVDQHFVVVKVDVGRYDKNVDIDKRFSSTGGDHFAPAVYVVTPAGKVLNPGDAKALADARRMSDQAVIDKLASWLP